MFVWAGVSGQSIMSMPGVGLVMLRNSALSSVNIGASSVFMAGPTGVHWGGGKQIKQTAWARGAAVTKPVCVRTLGRAMSEKIATQTTSSFGTEFSAGLEAIFS